MALAQHIYRGLIGAGSMGGSIILAMSGVELALWCDLRSAATDAIFGVYCRRWGSRW